MSTQQKMCMIVYLLKTISKTQEETWHSFNSVLRTYSFHLNLQSGSEVQPTLHPAPLEKSSGISRDDPFVMAFHDMNSPSWHSSRENQSLYSLNICRTCFISWKVHLVKVYRTWLQNIICSLRILFAQRGCLGITRHASREDDEGGRDLWFLFVSNTVYCK